MGGLRSTAPAPSFTWNWTESVITFLLYYHLPVGWVAVRDPWKPPSNKKNTERKVFLVSTMPCILYYSNELLQIQVYKKYEKLFRLRSFRDAGTAPV